MFKTDQWLSSLRDLYINIHELVAATPRSGLPVIVLSPSYWADASCASSHIINFHFTRKRSKNMSSLYKPFSVSDGPCKDAILRRGCTPLQHPVAMTRIPSAGGGSTRTFTPIPNIYPGQRNLAAAAIGGRKITHPWKAILAGQLTLNAYCVCVSCTQVPVFWRITRYPIMLEPTTTVLRDYGSNFSCAAPTVCHYCETHCQSMTCVSVLGHPDGSFQKSHVLTIGWYQSIQGWTLKIVCFMNIIVNSTT